jgi:hypothetical protein
METPKCDRCVELEGKIALLELDVSRLVQLACWYGYRPNLASRIDVGKTAYAASADPSVNQFRKE